MLIVMRMGKYKWILTNIIAVCGFLSISIWCMLEIGNVDEVYARFDSDVNASISWENLLTNFEGTISYWMSVYNAIASEGLGLIIFYGFDVLFRLALTCIFEIVAFVFFVKSIANLKNNQEKSVRNSKKSIKSAAIVYACQILCVLIFNVYFSLFAPYRLAELRLTFPYASVIFLLICIAMLKLPQLAGAAAAKNTSVAQLNSGVSNAADWYCTKCGKGNCNGNMFCIHCGEAKSICSNDDNEARKEASDNISPVASTTNDTEQIWYCSSCGKENAASDLYCVNCGKANESRRQSASLLAKDAVDKVKNIASNIPKPAIDAKGAVDKIKSAASNISLPTSNSKNDFEKIKQLKELLDIGAITQEEFDKKKAEILKL